MRQELERRWADPLSAEIARRNQQRDQNFTRIILKNSISSLGNAICIDNIPSRKSSAGPSKLESIRPPDILTDSPFGIDLQALEHEQVDYRVKSHEMSASKAQSSLLEHKNTSVRVCRNGRNISAAWRNRKPSKESLSLHK